MPRGLPVFVFRRLLLAIPVFIGVTVVLFGGAAIMTGHALAATWRYRASGEEHVRALRETRRPFVFVLWHSRILPLLYRHRGEGIVMLISRHRDGGYLADLGARWGYGSVRGSTRRGGEVGLLGIVRALEGGAVVAITPMLVFTPANGRQPGIATLRGRVMTSPVAGFWTSIVLPAPSPSRAVP